MWLRRNNYWLSGISMIIVFIGLTGTRLLAQQKQELMVTIEPLSSSDKLIHFNKAEDFRTQMKFREAIAEYQQVILPGDPCGKEAEAHYDIGICYTWLLNMEKATETFKEVIKSYSDDGIATAFAEFGLAWVETQQGKYYDAINRLQRKLAENTCPDVEHCAVMQFHIGRIYLVHLHDYENARAAFQKVLDNYPNSKISNHPFLDDLKGDK